MKKNEEGVSVQVVRLGSDPITVTLTTDKTVQGALTKAGVTVDNAQLFVDGVRADAGDELEDGDVLSIVTPKQAGSR